MDETTTLTAGIDESAAPATVPQAVSPAGDELVDDELLIEEISIDGMCGVY